jgi:hypothetical protein
MKEDLILIILAILSLASVVLIWHFMAQDDDTPEE